MNEVVIKEDGKKERRIDLTPVKKFASKLEEALSTEENRRDRKSVKLVTYFLESAGKMNEDQLKYLVNNLVSMAERYAFLFQSTLDEPEKHLKFVQEYRKLKEMTRKYRN